MKMEIKKLVAVLVIAELFASSFAFAGCLGSSKDIKNGKHILAAAKIGFSTAQSPGRRVTLDAAYREARSSDEAKQYAAVARTLVHISSPTLTDEKTSKKEKLNSNFGSGFFVMKSKCYIATVRHNLNKGENVLDKDGRLSFKVDPNHDPENARVNVIANFAPGATPQKLEGTVIAVGSFSSGRRGDVGLIRLDTPYDTGEKLSTDGTISDFKDVQIGKAGFAWDMQKKDQQPIVAIDKTCKGLVNEGARGVRTNCLVAPGDSGGFAFERKGNDWNVVGMWVATAKGETIVGSEKSTSSEGALPGSADEGQLINLRDFESFIKANIAEDQKSGSPCKEDLQISNK